MLARSVAESRRTRAGTARAARNFHMAPTRTAKVKTPEADPISRKSGTRRAVKPAPPPIDRALPKIAPIERAPSEPSLETEANAPTPESAPIQPSPIVILGDEAP